MENPAARLCLQPLLTLALSLLPAGFLQAGALDEAPFALHLPQTGWQLDTTEREISPRHRLVAYFIHDERSLECLIITGPITPTPTALEEIRDGFRDVLTNPATRILSDAESTFAGQRAWVFQAEVTANDVSSYRETILFVSGNQAWTIGLHGPAGQRQAIKDMLGFFKSRTE